MNVSLWDGGIVSGYLLAKIEGRGDRKSLHGHVTAITVKDESRGNGQAKFLMQHLNNESEKRGCFYIDLFVRKSNTAAIDFYRKLDY